MISIIRFIKKPVVIIIIVIIAIGFIWYVLSDGEDSGIETLVASRSDLVQEVSVIGRVKPAESVDLAFEAAGRIAFAGASVGEQVFVGQLLVELENGDVAAQLAQAQAKVKIEQAELNELIRGTRPEKIDVQEVEVSNAEILVGEAKSNLVNKINDAYTKADDAVRSKVDQFISNPRSSDPQLDFSISDSDLEREIEQKRFATEPLLTAWIDSLALLTVESNLSLFVADTKVNLDEVKSFLDKVALAVNELKSSSNLSKATIDSYRDDVSTARTNVNTAISNLLTAEEKLSGKEVVLALETQELVLMKAGSTPEEIAVQEANVEDAQANARRFQAELAKTMIRSPISGVVTIQDAKVGEIVGANTVIVSLASLSIFEIEANIPEADITKVQVGDNASLTLDAFSEDVVFTAIVFEIDPAETIIDGVSTYKVTLQFADDEGLAKSGMTADMDILTARRENVIAVPARSINGKGDDRFVRILNDAGQIEERKVKLGLRGSDGRIEIVSGVEEGERVVVFMKE